ncbi:MAG: hypothetical protein ACFFCQ_11440 [Promethearchaeota archaeon]
METEKKIDELIDGVIVTVFEDFGPSVRFNDSPLDEGQALNLAVKGMTALGDSPEKEIFGPFPIPELPHMRALAFMLNVASSDSEDERILEYGRSAVIWLIFSASKKRHILHASGLLQPYLTLLLSRLKTEEDMSESAMQFVNEKLTNIMTTSKTKVYGLDNQDMLIEFIDDSLVPASKVIMIADLNKNQLIILFTAPASPRFKRHTHLRASELNSEKWKNKLTIRAIDEVEEMNKILIHYKLDQLVDLG